MVAPRAIFFDLDETLVENITPIQDLFSSMYFEFEDKLGADNRDAFFAALGPRIRGLWNSMFLNDTPPEKQLARAFGETILALKQFSPAQANQLGDDMFTHFCTRSSGNVRLHPGALQTLADLHDRGYTTGIITNGIEQLQMGKIQALALQEHVDHVVVSAQARAHKPSRKVFELALDRAGVSADVAWQIGDNATNDVAGAIRAGMSGIFFDPVGDQLDTAFTNLEVQPTHVIAKLPQVVELLG